MDSYRHIPVFANPYELRIYRKPLQEKKKEVEFWNVKSIYRHPDYINDDIDLAILRVSNISLIKMSRIIYKTKLSVNAFYTYNPKGVKKYLRIHF